MKPMPILMVEDDRQDELLTLRSLRKFNLGNAVDVVYKRTGKEHQVRITPAKTTMDGQERWMIGVQLEPRMEMTRLAFPVALRESVRQNVKSAGLIYKMIEGIVIDFDFSFSVPAILIGQRLRHMMPNKTRRACEKDFHSSVVSEQWPVNSL